MNISPVLLVLLLIPLVPSTMLLYSAWTQPDWIVRVLFSFFGLIAWGLFLEQLRFCLPLNWRLKWPKWDKFLCKLGSHRCRRLCRSGCCWTCIRCDAEKDGKLNEHYVQAQEYLAGSKA